MWNLKCQTGQLNLHSTTSFGALRCYCQHWTTCFQLFALRAHPLKRAHHLSPTCQPLGEVAWLILKAPMCCGSAQAACLAVRQATSEWSSDWQQSPAANSALQGTARKWQLLKPSQLFPNKTWCRSQPHKMFQLLLRPDHTSDYSHN